MLAQKQKTKHKDKKKNQQQQLGAWVAQSVKHLTLAQVMISRFVSSSPASGEHEPHWVSSASLSPIVSAPCSRVPSKLIS